VTAPWRYAGSLDDIWAGEMRAVNLGVLTCAAHEWEFDARTGRGLNPASARLHSYPVRLDGMRIFVGVGEDK
jgi:toluene monooxygenase system ferredoxin subunit